MGAENPSDNSELNTGPLDASESAPTVMGMVGVEVVPISVQLPPTGKPHLESTPYIRAYQLD